MRSGRCYFKQKSIFHIFSSAWQEPSAHPTVHRLEFVFLPQPVSYTHRPELSHARRFRLEPLIMENTLVFHELL